MNIDRERTRLQQQLQQQLDQETLTAAQRGAREPELRTLDELATESEALEPMPQGYDHDPQRALNES